MARQSAAPESRATSSTSPVRPQPSGRRPHNVRSALAIGLRALRAHYGLVVTLLGATLAQGALQGLIVWELRGVLVRAGTAHGAEPLALTVGAMTILGVWSLRAFSTAAGELASAKLAQAVQVDAMLAVLKKLLTLSVGFYERNSQGDLVMAAYQDLRGLRTVVTAIGTLVLAASRLVALAAVAWLMSPTLAVIGLALVPLGTLPAAWLGQRITRAAKSERVTTARLHDSFLQVSAGIKLIKVYRGEERVLDRARAVGDELYRYSNRQAEANNAARFLLEAVSGVGLVVVLVLGGREVGKTLDWQSLMSLLIAIMAVYAPVLSLLSVYTSIRGALPTLDRVSEVMEERPELAEPPDARSLPQAPATIELQDVSFSYGDRVVLSGVCAAFRAGERIGIVGPSGAGKSTLLALLLRFYDVSAGRILLDGVDLRTVRHRDLMDRCAIVTQEPFLFVDTVANNIRFGRPDATMAEVVAAAKAANVHDEIEAMERGYDTILGRHAEGQGVSVGQKQRICIAAALLKNAPILLLDEATSNLDSVSELAVQGAIDRLMVDRTCFVVAHRLSTLRGVDRILVLEGGRVVGLGTHQDLLDTCETYQRLWRCQVGERDRTAERRALPVGGWDGGMGNGLVGRATSAIEAPR